jgi:hypothetical protein
MVCPKCGSEITEDTDFCGICGAKLADFADQIAEQKESEEHRRPHSKHERRRALRAKIINRAKLVLGILAVIAVVVAAVLIFDSLKKSEGERIFENVPLGRTVDIADKDTGVKFDIYSAYPVLTNISSYSYVSESERSVSVEGIKLPEWAVLLTKNTQNNISKVTYYEFASLKSSWKGNTLSEKINTDVIEYGQTIADVEKEIGLKPYVMISMLDNNTTECVFRYNTQNEAGDNVVYNLSVFIDDADDTVKYFSMIEKDYIGFFLSVN